jgi:hypothetical protein
MDNIAPVQNTYNIRYAYNDIQKAKKIIKELFKKNIVYDLKTIEYFILQKIPDLNKLFIYSALEEIVNNKNETTANCNNCLPKPLKYAIIIF